MLRGYVISLRHALSFTSAAYLKIRWRRGDVCKICLQTFWCRISVNDKHKYERMVPLWLSTVCTQETVYPSLSSWWINVISCTDMLVSYNFAWAVVLPLNDNDLSVYDGLLKEYAQFKSCCSFLRFYQLHNKRSSSPSVNVVFCCCFL